MTDMQRGCNIRHSHIVPVVHTFVDELGHKIDSMAIFGTNEIYGAKGDAFENLHKCGNDGKLCELRGSCFAGAFNGMKKLVNFFSIVSLRGELKGKSSMLQKLIVDIFIYPTNL